MEETILIFIVAMSTLPWLAVYFLLRQNQILTNKIMSRNYAEYLQAESIKVEKPEEPEEPDTGFDIQRAREINGMMGMGS